MSSMRSYPAKKQTLRLADGGMFRWANRLVGNNEQAQQQRGRTVEQVAPEAPVAAPVNPANPAGIKFADGGYKKGSLRGGRVHGPGDGTVDTVDAKYANGEYVLPTDTAQAIGYDKLDAIKDATHTPVAVQRGYSLRNPTGAQDEQEDKERGGSFPRGTQERQGATLRGDTEVDGRVAGYGARSDSAGRAGHESLGVLPEELGRERPQTLRLADGGIPGLDVLERPMTAADKAAFIQQPGPGNPNVSGGTSAQSGAYQGQRTGPFQTGVGTASAAAPATPQANVGRLRGAANAAGNFLTGAGESAGSVSGAVKNVAAPLISAGKTALNVAGKVAAPLTLGASAVDGLNTDTETYAKRFGLENTEPGVGRDLGVRALGVASDVGNNLSFGLAKKYLYREDGGSPSTATLRTPQPVASAAPAQAEPSAYNTPGADATMPGQDPNRITLRGQAGADVYGAPGVSKFTQNGKTLYSNVAGPDNDKLMSNNPGVSTVPGMGRAEIDAALTNPDGSRWSAGDNTIMAANLRDGVDAYRGTSRQAGEDATAMQGRMRSLALSPKGTPGRAYAQKQLLAAQEQGVTLRGQDLDYGAKQATARAAGLRAQQEQFNSDRTFKAGRTDAANAQLTADQARGFKSSENATRRLESLAIVDGKVDPARLAQARALTNSIAPGFDQMDEAGQNAVWQKVLSANKLTSGANTLRDPGPWNAIGLGKASPESATLPDFDGSDVSEVGFWEGALTAGPGRGDYAVTKNGRTQFIPRSAVGQNELELMKNNGARLRN